MDIKYVLTLTSDPQAEKPVLEPPRDVSDELTEACDESTEDDVRTSQFVNPVRMYSYLEATMPSFGEDDLSSVDLGECEDEWMAVDVNEVPTVDSHKKEAGWENVEVNIAVAQCGLDGEDDYSIESFRSNRRKEELSGCSRFFPCTRLILQDEAAPPKVKSVLPQAIKDAVPPSVMFLKSACKAVFDTHSTVSKLLDKMEQAKVEMKCAEMTAKHK